MCLAREWFVSLWENQSCLTFRLPPWAGQSALGWSVVLSWEPIKWERCVETCHLPNCVSSKGQATFARHFLSTQVEWCMHRRQFSITLSSVSLPIFLNFLFFHLNSLRKQTYSEVRGNRKSDTCGWECKLVQPLWEPLVMANKLQSRLLFTQKFNF